MTKKKQDLRLNNRLKNSNTKEVDFIYNSATCNICLPLKNKLLFVVFVGYFLFMT
jgi:hypothetical protein